MTITRNKNLTRERIMAVAAKMFSDKGYNKVTTREIAKAADANPAMIYYYFASKEELLQSLYQYYTNERIKETPDMEELLRLTETLPPHEVLMKSAFYYDESKREMMDQILVTAAREICADPESERFIRESIFDSIDQILGPVLRRLLELKRIKPFDVDAFLKVVSYYCCSAATLNNSSFNQSSKDYQAGMALLFSIIAPEDA